MADPLGNEPFGPTAFATGTTAAWQASEMIPADKQLVFVRDGGVVTQRLGDGVTPALDLPIVGGPGGGDLDPAEVNSLLDTRLGADATGLLAPTGKVQDARIPTSVGRLDAKGRPAKQYLSWLTDFVDGSFTSHRTGGGDHPYVITASRSAVRSCIAAGQRVLDLDSRYSQGGDINNGKLYMVHDDELSLYSDDISGSIKTTSTALVEAATMSGSKIVGGTYPNEPFLSLGDLVTSFGNRILTAVELKNQTSAVDWRKSIELFRKTLLDIGGGAINNVVAVMGFPNALDAAHLAVMDDYPDVLWGTYSSSSDTGFNLQSNYELLKAHGCIFVGVSLSVSDTLLSWLKANFISVSGYADRRTTYDAAIAKGFVNMGGEYGAYTVRRNAIITEAPWKDGKQILGLIPADNHFSPTLQRDGLLFDKPYGNQQWALAGDFAPLPATVTLNLEFTVSRLGGQWYGMMFGQVTDGSAAGAGGSQIEKTGYIAWMGPTGRVYLYVGNGTTYTALGSSATGNAITTPGEDRFLRVIITPTDVTVQAVDPTTGVLIPTQFYTATDTTYRQGFLTVGAQLNTLGAMKIRRLYRA